MLAKADDRQGPCLWIDDTPKTKQLHAVASCYRFCPTNIFYYDSAAACTEWLSRPAWASKADPDPDPAAEKHLQQAQEKEQQLESSQSAARRW